MENQRRARLMRKLDEYELTDFQKTVLIKLIDIPKGQMRSYKQIAEAIGKPKAYRAVGTAVGKNPLAPDIPCHRVIKSSGDIGNYSGRGGIKRKIRLLKSESAI